MSKKVGEYILGECIGSGMYGEVYKSTSNKRPGEWYAIKQISKKNMSQKVVECFEREVDILEMFDHEHVVRLQDVRATDHNYYLVFEYCNGGDLQSFRKRKGGRLTESTVRAILVQIVSGMNDLYAKKAIHRDIKLSNLLLHYPDAESLAQDRPIVKIGDFGFARLITQVEASDKSISDCPEVMSFVGTPLNMAPELFHKQPYSFKADVWSLGTIVYELLCGTHCFTGVSKDDLMANIDKGFYRVPKQLSLSAEALDFLNACLQLDPTLRIKWRLLREHPFVVSTVSTPFNLASFKQLNPVLDHPLEDTQNYVLSSKGRASFWACSQQSPSVSGEDEKDGIQASASPTEEAAILPLCEPHTMSPTKDTSATSIALATTQAKVKVKAKATATAQTKIKTKTTATTATISPLLQERKGDDPLAEFVKVDSPEGSSDEDPRVVVAIDPNEWHLDNQHFS